MKGSGGVDGNGFLGLFATLSDNKETALSSTNAPMYLGDIDLEELKKYHDFKQVKDSNSVVAKYLKLKNMLSQKKNLEMKKKNSREIIKNKLLQNRRLSIDYDDVDDSDEKISALQMLIKNNIKDSLNSQAKHLSVNKNDLSPNHMAYVIPSAENLNIYNSQVEKPLPVPAVNGQLQNLPFLDTSQYKSQSILINPSANVRLPHMQSNTPNPVNTDVHSTLPFLDVQQSKNLNFQSLNQNNQPMVLANFNDLMKGSVQSRPQGNLQSSNLQHNPQQYNHGSNQNFYGTSFVTPSYQNQPQQQYPFNVNTNSYSVQASSLNSKAVDRSDSYSNGGTNSYYLHPQSLNPTGINSLSGQHPYKSVSTSNTVLGSKLEEAKLEQKKLETELARLKALENNLKMDQFTARPPTSTLRSNYPRSLSGFPMNFEDMLATGLQLAKQSNRNSLQNQNVAEHIHPRTSNNLPQTSWGSTMTKHVQDMSQDQYSSQYQLPDDFSPSERISPMAAHQPEKLMQNQPGKMMQQKPEKLMQSTNLGLDKKNQRSEHDGVGSNSIKTDQIHIIGPNCYIMSNGGFKFVGKAPKCVPSDPKSGSNPSSIKHRNHGRSGSIWDSITSLPLVNKFAKNFGIK